MTGKERVLRAVRREGPGAVPTSLRCMPEVWKKLGERLGEEDRIGVMDHLGIDYRWCILPYTGPQSRCDRESGGTGEYNLWGCRMKAVTNPYGTYYEAVSHPLEHADAKEIEEYAWPSLDWWDYQAIPRQIQLHKRKDDTAVMYMASGPFEIAWMLRGFEQFLMDLYEQPELADLLMEKITEYLSRRAARVLEAADGQIDIVGSASDFGTQRGLLMGVELWRERMKPFVAKLITPFRQQGLVTYYHSCGAIVPLIPDLIELGLQILDPLQARADGMDADSLSQKFGGKLTFHGGLDEQELLPNGTPQQVYDETCRLIETLGKEGGYIVAPCHELQNDTPTENILAIYEAAKQYR